jgi:hypothetical protein
VSEQDDQELDAHELTDELAKKYDPERLLKIVGKRAGKGEALDASLRHRYEKRFGVDLGHVRIFNNSFAERFNRDRNAFAVTIGNTGMVMMGNSPTKSMASAEGQALLAHELTHVAQQSRHAGGGLHRKATHDMPFAEEHELEAEDTEIDVYQKARGVKVSQDYRMSRLSAHAKVQHEHRIKEATEKIKKRVIDILGESARNQGMRGGSGGRRA